jgi:hypothetical protein
MSDPILEEVRRTRKEIEAEHGNDWKALERYFVAKQNSAPVKKVIYKPKKLPTTSARKRPRVGRRHEEPTVDV